jgi:hypothetical protein
VEHEEPDYERGIRSREGTTTTGCSVLQGDNLKRWGMTPQKPLKKAYEQLLARVQQWLDETNATNSC